MFTDILTELYETYSFAGSERLTTEVLPGRDIVRLDRRKPDAIFFNPRRESIPSRVVERPNIHHTSKLHVPYS